MVVRTSVSSPQDDPDKKDIIDSNACGAPVARNNAPRGFRTARRIPKSRSASPRPSRRRVD